MKPVPVPEQRHSSGIRRDINDLVRGEDGKLSGSKIGTYAGQYISGYLLFTSPALPSWDELAVLFTVLIAPELWKLVLRMKYGNVVGGEGTVSQTDTQTSTRKVSKP